LVAGGFSPLPQNRETQRYKNNKQDRISENNGAVQTCIRKSMAIVLVASAMKKYFSYQPS